MFRRLPLALATAFLGTALLAPSLAAQSNVRFVASPPVQRGQATSVEDIVETAKRAGFRTLVAALEAADMVELLQGDGPMTVFAPSDEAFASLPVGTLQELLRPENKAKLRAILALHVVQGRLVSYEVGNIDAPQMARMSSGERLAVSANRSGFKIGEATVVAADLRCKNGWIHAIDRVLLPAKAYTENSMKMAMKEAAPTSLLAALRAAPDGRYSTFLAAVEASGADQDWAQPEPTGNWTVFVPTNAAFARIDPKDLTRLLDPTNREALRALLDWHAVPELKPFGFLLNDRELAPAMISNEGDRFVLDVLCNGMVFVYTLRTSWDRESEEPFKARIIAGDIPVGGSLVHVVDRVMLPPLLENKFLGSQAYKESDVKELSAAKEAEYNATYALADMLDEARELDERGALTMYRFGLRLLEDVLPVNRNGMMILPGDLNDPAELRARLRARIDDLDRVWFASFLKNSPAATSLYGDSTGGEARPRVEPEVGVVAPATPAQAVPATMTPVERRTEDVDLSWCEVLEQAVDPKVVTDPALRSALSATGLPWRVKDRSSGIEMLLVPSGSFMMGKSPGDEDARANEVPAHPVTISRPYYLGRYEVTQAQWSQVMDRARSEAAFAGKREQPAQDTSAPLGGGLVLVGRTELRDEQGNIVVSSSTTTRGEDGTFTITTTAGGPDRERDSRPTAPDAPIVTSWNQIEMFARSTGLRLPTEAEWEYACRAGVDQPRSGPLDEIAWHRGNSPAPLNPVGGKAANGLGFHDMIGNAWEVVGDWYADYTRQAQVDPAGPASGQQRILRGSYFDFDGGFCRASLRYPARLVDRVSFRAARTP
jgi:uncharacterized surface protein with fasciclin (FAS1) repeats/formylglycine-generating enzyme required for sulfatase activity